MQPNIKTIGFDADDTLWHNETFFKMSQERFVGLLADYSDPTDLGSRLYEAEVRNIKHYGYGVKGFTLSMIETAIEISEDRVPASLIREIVDMGRDMLDHPMDLLPGAKSAVEKLSVDFKLVLITKGDLLHQERKLAQSGLGDFFNGVEIVSEKDPQVYVDAFERHSDGPTSAMMVGNSMKSDILPALEAGSWGTHVPFHLEWDLEKAPEPVGNERFRTISDLSKLEKLVREVSRAE